MGTDTGIERRDDLENVVNSVEDVATAATRMVWKMVCGRMDGWRMDSRLWGERITLDSGKGEFIETKREKPKRTAENELEYPIFH